MICPICGKEFTERPALSRKDDKTEICPMCSSKEAMEAAGWTKEMCDAAIEKIVWYPKSFYWCGSTSNSVFERNLESESLEDAKAELEKILLESSIKALKQADDDYRKRKEYCRKRIKYLSDSNAAIEWAEDNK